MEVSEILSPAGLAAGQILLGEDILEGVMVSEEGELLAAIEVVPEGAEGIDDCKELQLVDRVVFLGTVELAGFIGDRVAILHEDGADANQGGVSVEGEGGISGGVGEREDRGSGEGGLELHEGIDGGGRQSAREGYEGGGECREGGSDGGIVADEATIEASEAEEGTDVGGAGRERPICEGLDLAGVNRDACRGDLVAEEGGGGFGKSALGGLDKEGIGSKGVEDGVDVLQVLLGGGAVDHDII